MLGLLGLIKCKKKEEMQFAQQGILMSMVRNLNIPEGSIDISELTNLVTTGDSIAVGNNASAGNSWRELLVANFIFNDQTLAIGGLGYWSQVDAYNFISFTRLRTLIIDETGLNDIRRSWTQKTRNKIRASVDTILARAAGLNAYASGSASVTRSSGTFTTFDARSLGGFYGTGAIPGDCATYSSDVGATWSWNFNTEHFFIAFSGSDGTAARGNCEVWVDGVLIETITDLDEQWDGVSDGTNDNQRGPDTRVYWDFGAGPHTCEVIITSAAVVAIDRFVEMGDPDDCGVLLLMEIPKVVDYAKVGLDQANDAIVTQANELRLNRLNIFNTRGYKFYYVPIMNTSPGGLYDLANVDPADDVHPTTAGHLQIYNSVKQYLSTIHVRDTFTGSSGSIAGHSPEVGGSWTIGAGTITINGSGSLVCSSAGECYQTVTGNSDITVISIGRVSVAGNPMGIVLRYTDTNNYILLRLIVDGASSSIVVINRVAGVSTTVNTGTAPGTLAINTDYRFRAKIVGGHIYGYLNDTLLVDYDDSGAANIGANNPTGVTHGFRLSTATTFKEVTMI